MKIVKIPFSSGSLGKNNGCEKAPDLLVERLRKYELNEDGKSVIFEVSEVKTDKNNFDLTFENIGNEEGDIFIGGDHSIKISPSSFPIFSKVKSKLFLSVLTSETSKITDFPSSFSSYFLSLSTSKSGAFSHPLFFPRLPEEKGILTIFIKNKRAIIF